MSRLILCLLNKLKNSPAAGRGVHVSVLKLGCAGRDGHDCRKRYSHFTVAKEWCQGVCQL